MRGRVELVVGRWPVKHVSHAVTHVYHITYYDDKLRAWGKRYKALEARGMDDLVRSK